MPHWELLLVRCWQNKRHKRCCIYNYYSIQSKWCYNLGEFLDNDFWTVTPCRLCVPLAMVDNQAVNSDHFGSNYSVKDISLDMKMSYERCNPLGKIRTWTQWANGDNKPFYCHFYPLIGSFKALSETKTSLCLMNEETDSIGTSIVLFWCIH